MGRILLTERFIAGVNSSADDENEYVDAQVRRLRLRVLPSGLKEWSSRYTSPRDGSRKRLRLGYYPGTGLAAARGKALEVNAILDAGDDPYGRPLARSGPGSRAGRERIRHHAGARPDE